MGKLHFPLGPEWVGMAAECDVSLACLGIIDAESLLPHLTTSAISQVS